MHYIYNKNKITFCPMICRLLFKKNMNIFFTIKYFSASLFLMAVGECHVQVP